MNDELLYPEQLAVALKRGRGYVFAMKDAGFEMPGGTATFEEAREWLRRYPDFKSTPYFKKQTEKAKPVKAGRKKSLYISDAPDGYTERECYFRDGEDVIKHPDLAVCDQILIDNANGEDEAFGDSFVAELFTGKVKNLDHSFFEALARMLKRRAEQAPPLDPVRWEMMLVKMKADSERRKLTWQDVSDKLKHCRADKKTIEKAADDIGLTLVKRPRGRPSNK